VNVRLASYADGVSRVPSGINLAELFPWAGRKVLVERVPVRVSSLADLPLEASAERPSWSTSPSRMASSGPDPSNPVILPDHAPADIV